MPNDNRISRAVSRIKQRDTPAIAELKRSLDVMQTNEPINRRDGNIGLANDERINARSFRDAIAKLQR